MAYQARDPLFDTTTAASLEKRGRELAGLALLVCGLMAAAMIWSYAPDDPSFLAATDAPVQNWLGRFGASVAAPLFMIVGCGAWALALVLVVWGARLAAHRGDARILGRIVFAPVWVAVCAIYAAGLPGTPGWEHHFGLGGHFGDMMMGSLVTLMPFGTAASLKILQVLLALGMAVLGAFVLGFTRVELQRIARFLLVGVVMVYATLVALMGRGASGALRTAQGLQAAQADRRARAQADAAAQVANLAQMPSAPKVMRGGEAPQEEPAPQDLDASAKGGFLSRMPALMRKPAALPDPELIESDGPADVEAPGEDRIRAKIAQAVSTPRRTAPSHVPQAQPDPNKPLTKGRGRGPQPLILNTTGARSGLPPEPPVSSGMLPPEPPLTASRVPPVPAPQRAGGVVPTVPGAEQGTQAWQGRATAMPAAPQPVPSAPFAEVMDEDEEAAYGTMRDFDDYGDPPEAHETEAHDQGFVAEPDPAPVAAEALPPLAPVHRGPVATPMPTARKVVQQPARKAIQPSRRAQEEAQPQLAFEDNAADYELPPLNLLMSPDEIERHHLSDEALEENARMLETVLDDYGVKGEIVSVRPGPVVTMYELEPAPGLKASRVIGLADDIARSMEALSARVSTVPGRSVIGIELPNIDREMVSFREILSSREYGDGKHKLPLALGKNIGGDPVVANLAKMPHLLIAGTTGSGKSVAINTMILSLLYKLSPDQCRLIMIDPKMLELSVYDGIPHLLSPVVTDPKKAVVALKWVVGEMEDRYRKMSKMGVRNIDGYNSRVEDALGKGEMFERTVQTGFDDETGEPVFETEQIQPVKMPYIVVIVDEMADLMMVAGKEIEACIQRLAQMARASGIHLIMATQRPSVDVITGTIKANFPTRISFQVTSKIDSRTILGEMGAEQLLGMGDMLYMGNGSKIMRCHGPFVSDEEVEEVVNHLKAFGPPDYVGGVVEGPDDEKADDIDAVLGLNTGGNTGGEDALYDQAVAIVIKDRKCSTSYIQRKLGIGYNKAARLVEQMEDEGVVSAANHVGKREILVPEQ